MKERPIPFSGPMVNALPDLHYLEAAIARIKP